MAAVQFPFLSVSEMIELLQAAQALGYGSLPVLLGPPDGELRPVTVVEHIVSEGVLLRDLSREDAQHYPGYSA